MVSPVREQWLFFIKWLVRMSYINEALKKAQKEKDGKSISYIHLLETSVEKSWPFYRKAKYITLIIVFIIVLILSFELWSGFISTGEDSINERSFDQHLDNSKKDVINPLEKEDAIEIEQNQESILFNKAVSLTRENRIDEAKLTYRKVLRINPGHLKALNDLGVLLLHEGEYELALSYFEKAVRLDPDNVDPYYNLACLYALSGDEEKGMAHLIKAADLDSRVKDWIKEDNDLASLKDLPEFYSIME